MELISRGRMVAKFIVLATSCDSNGFAAEQPIEKVTRSVSKGRQYCKIFEKQLPRSRCGLLQIPFFNGLLYLAR